MCPCVATILELAKMTFGAKYQLVEMNVDEDLCAFTLKRV